MSFFSDFKESKFFKPVIVAVIVAVVIFLLWFFLSTDDVQSHLSKKEWKRSYTIEKFQWTWIENSQTGYYPAIDANARDLQQWQTVSIWYSSIHTGKYSTVLVPHTTYWYHVRFQGQRWLYDQTLTNSGTQRNDVAWPEFTPTEDTRIAYRQESYSLWFPLHDQQTSFVTDKFSYYKKIQVEELEDLIVNKFGAILNIKDKEDIHE